MSTAERDQWWHRASCLGRPLSWWYPAQGDTFSGRVARLVCQGCPVRSECLASALDEERTVGLPPVGIRGGRTGRQREVMLRQLRLRGVQRDEVPVPPPTGRRAWPRHRFEHYAEAL